MELVSTGNQSEFQFDLTGGQPALDLANTVSRRDNAALRNDHLANYVDLLAFVRQSKLLPPKQARELHSYALHHAGEARRSFAQALKLREAMYRVFSAIAQQKTVADDDLRVLNDFAVEAVRHRALAQVNGGYGWKWAPNDKNVLEQAIWPVAQAAADLLTSDDLRIVRFCEAPDCEWLFLDRSRNRSRRWCDMTTCGNRAKARRHYQRVHE